MEVPGRRGGVPGRDEMTGPALLLLGFAVTGRPAAGSELLAALTVAAAVGGPLFGALLDRRRVPRSVRKKGCYDQPVRRISGAQWWPAG